MSKNVSFTARSTSRADSSSGKTPVGVVLAHRLDAEVVALDSMTLYRGMDIATAKPSLAERGGIRHHLIDVIDPWQSASVVGISRLGREAVARDRGPRQAGPLRRRHASLLESAAAGFVPGPWCRSTSSASGWSTKPSSAAIAALHQRLAVLDPTAAARLHPHDRRSVVRALEVFELTGRPISDLQAEHDRPAPAEVPVFALGSPPYRVCTHRINRRVVQFFDDGLVDEVQYACKQRPNRCATWPRRRSATVK